jgi:hypothetical protein
MTVWIYDQGADLKVFATEEAAQAWLDENDPEGVAFEYDTKWSVRTNEPIGRRTIYVVLVIVVLLVIWQFFASLWRSARRELKPAPSLGLGAGIAMEREPQTSIGPARKSMKALDASDLRSWFRLAGGHRPNL